MVIEGWVMSVYCDYPGCDKRWENCYGATKTLAWMTLKAAGWVRANNTTVYCRSHKLGTPKVKVHA